MAYRHAPRRTRLAAAVAAACLLGTVAASTALAGEVTGNGKLLTMHGRSECSFSGQEDLQFFTDDSDAVAKDVFTRGDPAHAQSWGQIPKAIRDELATLGLHPGTACNPTRSGGGEP
jgi:hypothetical protein